MKVAALSKQPTAKWRDIDNGPVTKVWNFKDIFIRIDGQKGKLDIELTVAEARALMKAFKKHPKLYKKTG